MSRFEKTAFLPESLQPGLPYSDELVVFVAREVVTLDDAIPFANAVAVQNGRIVAAGERELIENAFKGKAYTYRVDNSFADAVIYPGFIEAHMHPQISGALHRYEFIGRYDRHRPDGSMITGIKTRAALAARLRELVDAHRSTCSDGEWFNAWGLDPLVLDDRSLIARDFLDQIATDIPIAVQHMSAHLIALNSKAIEICGIETLDLPGIRRDANGRATGELAASAGPLNDLVVSKGGLCLARDEADMDKATWDIAKIASLNGCTTIAEKGLLIGMIRPGLEAYIRASQSEDYPVRLVLEPWFAAMIKDGPGTMRASYQALKQRVHNDRISIGNLKLLLDGSIQGFSANLLDKQYYNGNPNGNLQMPDERALELFGEAHRSGISCSVHTNGNGATEQLLRVVEALQAEYPRADVYHSSEHCQLATEEQLWRMKKVGLRPNFFINHIHFWGDAHAAETVGPHYVKRQNPLRSAMRHGLTFGIHSDDWVTEVNPLLSAWVAVNRRSASGQVYGEDQCLTVDEAMRAITLGNAAMLGQEHIKGSVTPGKLADFTVLAEKVSEANKETFRDIPVLATVLGGKIFKQH